MLDGGFRWNAVGVLLVSALAHAEGDEGLLSLPLEELTRLPVNIATGTPTTIQQAPSVASVITAQDMLTMGAEDMNQALESVPGLHVSASGLVMSSFYYIRGIATVRNPETLVLVNGLPMTSLWLGDRLPDWQGVPVKAVKRIEIIRGPGSAVYGADAFAGVINIITKGIDDLTGGEASVSHGSFNTTRASVLDGGNLGPIQAALALSYHETQGERRIIDADIQSSVDSLHFAPPASLAPGPVNTGIRDMDARMELQWGDYRLRTSWQQLWNAQTGQGIANALDPSGRFGASFGNADLSWHNANLSKDWDLVTQFSYGYKNFVAEDPVVLYPPGAFFGSFPKGVLEDPFMAEHTARLELTGLYSGFAGHRLRLGLGNYWGDLFETKDKLNYRVDPAFPLLLLPLPGGMTDVTHTASIFQPEASRRDQYAFTQDEWNLAPDWTLTAGLRFDHYSDVGSTANPRLALVWNMTPALTSKLLYGEAFRAPSFAELYVQSNPVARGNPDLKPEKLKSAEVAFAYRPEAPWTLDLNAYQLRSRNFITYVPDVGAPTFTAQNVGEILGRGVETEVRYQTPWPLQLLLNESYQRTVDELTGKPLGLAPRDKTYGRMVWDLKPKWQITTQVTRVGLREREVGDPRQSLRGYMTVDLTIRRLQLPHGVEMTLSGTNLFNVDVREPTQGPGSGLNIPAIPHDIPEPGRSIVGAIDVAF